MKRVFPALLVVVCLVGLFTTAGAQPDGAALRINLVDNANQPVTNAKVMLYDENGNLVAETKTNSNSNVASLLAPGKLMKIGKGMNAENYALRVIADDGNIGVLWLSNKDLARGHLNKNQGIMVRMTKNPNKKPQYQLTDSAATSLKSNPMPLSDGFMVKESTVSAGLEWTTVAEIHACDKAYSTIELTSGSDIKVQAAKKHEGGSWEYTIGFVYEQASSSSWGDDAYENTGGGHEVQQEYEYELDTWVQYDGAGIEIDRWQELHVARLHGSSQYGDATNGDLAPYNHVVSGSFGERELIGGGWWYSRTYTKSWTWSQNVELLGATLDVQTDYSSSSKVEGHMHTYDKPTEHYSNYAIYSRDSSGWPRTLFTNDYQA